MSSWTSIHEEVAGVATAVRNLNGNLEDIAEYVYDRACAYRGAAHETVTVALIVSAMAEAQKLSIERLGQCISDGLVKS